MALVSVIRVMTNANREIVPTIEREARVPRNRMLSFRSWNRETLWMRNIGITRTGGGGGVVVVSK